MRFIIAAIAVTAVLGGGVAHAQTELDHRVQRAWDDVFSPPPPGDPRTNWERHRDQADRAAYLRRQENEHAVWCHDHPGEAGCGRY